MADIQHSVITSADCHEPKFITASTTADSGKVITPSSTVSGTSELRLLTASDIGASGQTSWGGWGKWADATYTSSVPFEPPASRTKILVDGAGTQTNTTYMPTGSSDYWNTSTNKIVADNEGDAYILRVNFKGITTTANDFFEIDLDIGGSIGVILSETKVFTKGTSIEHNFVFSWPIYTLDTFVANGGELYITPDSANQEFYDIEVQVIKVYSGA